MSYCRFSTNDFQCDVYVYEDCVGGWTTHVASNRIVPCKPLPPVINFSMDNADEWLVRYQNVQDIIRNSVRESIYNPYAGKFYNDDTPGECADRLEMLRKEGFRVPQSAIDALREENKDDENE